MRHSFTQADARLELSSNLEVKRLFQACLVSGRSALGQIQPLSAEQVREKKAALVASDSVTIVRLARRRLVEGPAVVPWTSLYVSRSTTRNVVAESEQLFVGEGAAVERTLSEMGITIVSVSFFFLLFDLDLAFACGSQLQRSWHAYGYSCF
jgi:capsular polysaccharide biosynthesis protein